MKPLLEVNDLTIQVNQQLLLHNVSFKVVQGRITALVGGSGSGKTTIASAILGLLPPALEVTRGQILFEHKNLSLLNKEQMRLMRGSSIAMVFQEPLGAFNPLMTIGQQIDEVLEIHTKLHKDQRWHKILDVLSRVELPNPAEVYHRYPHQLSGGQRQRAMIAQAVVAHPKLIIADEPTSNLDVILQARIMDLFRRFKREGMTILLISHDLGMVSHLADDVVILDKGQVVEEGSVNAVMKHPKHTYTQRLMEAFQ
ncbi:MAG: ABC transporter ATP-binding protein [Candidatus Omnitrophica bacterium]|nr:ABC transporter ATP-binding protein [Candidatus Omnitrophota bacterium]